MKPETARVKLPGGEWWDIKAFLTRGDRKKINRLERTWVKTRTDMTPEEIAKNPREAIQFDAENADIDARDDLMLELGTVAWSYPEAPGVEAFDKMDDEIIETVLKRMSALYLKREAEAIKKLKKA